MLSEAATPLVIELAKSVVSLMRSIRPDWRTAYLRVCIEDGTGEAKASYTHDSGAEIVDVFDHKAFFRESLSAARDLFGAIGKEGGLLLLVVDSTLDYEIKFEYAHMRRWAISKVDGGTGVPVGL